MKIATLQLLFCLVLVSLGLRAQSDVSAISVPLPLLKQHVFALADDSLQGRETGTPSQLTAARYCVKSFRKSHLLAVFRVDSVRGSFYQPFYFTSTTLALFKPRPGQTPVMYKKGELLPAPVTAKDSAQVLQGHNVAGFILGTDRKQEIVVISAHYDHVGRIGGRVFPGADDNASGTATVLSVASVFDSLAQQGIRSRRSILFVLFSGEENGLLGSTYFVNNSPIPITQLVGNLNTDMIGRIDNKHRKHPDYCYLITGSENSRLRRLAEQANKQSVRIELDYEHDTEDDPKQYFSRSDHYNLAKLGVPVLFFTDGEHPDYHQPSDKPEKIEFDLLAKRATLIFQTAWLMAN
ncbi:M28 family peptidase [Spirosoma sp. SC4-14]|uniref:M28 family peptidase n=1 Tax=Spirosoma sp. SC4-14 TaxID=3128900 RepID=UPI0030CAEE47